MFFSFFFLFSFSNSAAHPSPHLCLHVLRPDDHPRHLAPHHVNLALTGQLLGHLQGNKGHPPLSLAQTRLTDLENIA